MKLLRRKIVGSFIVPVTWVWR